MIKIWPACKPVSSTFFWYLFTWTFRCVPIRVQSHSAIPYLSMPKPYEIFSQTIFLTTESICYIEPLVIPDQIWVYPF